jgi:hypothetical protein
MPVAVGGTRGANADARLGDERLRRRPGRGVRDGRRRHHGGRREDGDGAEHRG